MSFEFKVSELDAACELVLKGDINESVNFKNIKLIPGKHLIIDLSGIRLLNSVGLRSWVLWARELDYAVVSLRRCPNPVVNQMNILDGFLPLRAVIESFELPYMCESCGHEESHWAMRGKDYYERTADKAEWVKVKESIPCPKCGEKADLDVLPLKYFGFLKGRRL